MPRVDVPVTTTARTATALPAETNGDATNGHSFTNDGRTIILARNSSGASTRTLTEIFATAAAVDSQAPTSRVVTLGVSETHVLGPFPTAWYGTTMNFDVSHADVKLRTVKLG